MTAAALAGPVPGAGWTAALSLVFRRLGNGTILAERRHHGPLVVQKPLYPEGPSVCHAAIVHAPGGIAGGDELALTLNLGPAAHALLTTPAAGKWYKSAGREAWQRADFTVSGGAILEWLPQETIVFDQAMARIDTAIDLAADAVFTGWEIACLGRRASGERFAQGRLSQSTTIRRDGRLIWNERLSLVAGDRLLTSPIGLNGCHVAGTMIVAAGALPVPLLDACRAVTPRGGEGGVTALPDIVVARYLGHGAEHAKAYFESLRGALRPWYAGRPAQKPRLWDT